MSIAGRYVPGAARIPFVNREEILEAFDEEVNVLGGAPRLLALYGVGGIGKSRLLHELRHRIHGTKVPTATLNVQEPALRTADAGLASLRVQLDEAGVRFPRFDIAYATWWQRLHPMTPLGAAHHPWIRSSEVLAEVGELALGVPLLGTAVKVIDTAARKSHQAQLIRDDDVLRELPELSEERLQDAVVHLFASDLNKHNHVLFVDAYEALEAGQPAGSGSTGAIWLRDLVGQLDGLVVVASREPIDWIRHDPGWEERIRLLEVPPLSDDAQIKLLGELGVTDPKKSRTLAEASNGLPYFLHLAHETGIARAAYARLEERFMQHVDAATARYLRLLSVARVFDRGVFNAVAEHYRLPHDGMTWETLTGYSFMAQSGPDALQMHQLMARAIREKLTDPVASELHALLAEVWTQRATEAPSAAAWREAAFHAAATSTEDETLSYADKLGALGKPGMDAMHDDLLAAGRHPGLARLVAAEAYLVVGDAHGALESLGDVPKDLTDGTSEVGARLALAVANAYRIAGATSEAIDRLQRIWPQHQGPCRYDAGGWLADLRMAEGRFADAVKIAADVEREAPAERAVLRADLARLRSLAHRFAFDLPGAHDHLERAREAYKSIGHRVGVANILTNEAEILAHTDPAAAVNVARAAVVAQEGLGSDIEIGKAQTALALALIASDVVDEAGQALDRAFVALDRCGYRSGRARADLVDAFRLARSGLHDDAVAAATRAVDELEDAEVYPVLIALGAMLLDRIGRPVRQVREAAERARARVQPIDGTGHLWDEARRFVARLLGDSWDVEYERALAAHSQLSGYYNVNLHSGGHLIRVPITGADTMDLRIWDEADVLAAVQNHFPGVPRLVSVSREPSYQIHEWIDGAVLDDVAPKGTPLPDGIAEAAGALLAQIAEVPLTDLPPAPEGWPSTGDSVAFAKQLFDVTRAVHADFRDRYADLWSTLGIPDDPFAALELGALADRPFVLVHADVHRKNVIVRPDGRLVFLDWELALPGDPVYELAVHLHKTDYTPSEVEQVRTAWAATWNARASLPQSWERDLDRYLAHERVKSAVVDSVRYAKDLGAGRRAASGQDGYGTTPLEERALAAAANYAPKLARARKVWDDPWPVDTEAIAASLIAASSV